MYNMLKLSVSLSSLVGPFRYYVGNVYMYNILKLSNIKMFFPSFISVVTSVSLF